AGVNFLFKRGDFALRLLDLQSGTICIELYAPIEFGFNSGEPGDFSLGFGELEIVSSQFIFGGGLLRNQTRERVVVSLKPIALSDCGRELAGRLSGLIGFATCLRGIEVVLSLQKL